MHEYRGGQFGQSSSHRAEMSACSIPPWIIRNGIPSLDDISLRNLHSYSMEITKINRSRSNVENWEMTPWAINEHLEENLWCSSHTFPLSPLTQVWLIDRRYFTTWLSTHHPFWTARQANKLFFCHGYHLSHL